MILADVHSDFLVWHDQFKTAVLAQAATFGLVAADTTPITNDNTDIHAKVTSVNSTSAIATQAVADKNTSRANANKHARALAARIKAHPAYTVALGSLLGIEGPQDTTDLTTSKPTLTGIDQTGGVVELDFDKSISDGVNIYAKRDGDADFVFLACRAEVRRRRALHRQPPVARRHQTRTARIQSRLCPERCRNWLVQR